MTRTELLRSTALTTICTALVAATAAAQCGEWTSVDPPAGALAVIDVEVRSANEAYATAYNLGLIRWDGTTWSQFPTEFLCGEYASGALDQFCLVGSSEIVVVGRGSTGPFSNDQVLQIWDGGGWGNCNTLTLEPNIIGAPRNGAPNWLVAPSIDDVWILGAASGAGDATGSAYLIVHWDGSDLTEVGTMDGPGNSMKSFRDGLAFASNDIWAVGQYRIIGAGTPGYHASTYHFNGTSWSYVPNPAETLCCQSTNLNTVAGVSPDDMWAAGSYGAEPLFMHYDGTSWTIVPGPAGATGTIYEMVAIASDDVWAVDAAAQAPAYGKFYHWDGTAWSIVLGREIPGAVGVERHGGLAAVGPCDVWAVGSYNFGVSPVLPLIERLQTSTNAPGDVNEDGTVNFADVLTVIAEWGPCAGPCPADLDGNGAVGFSDILVVIANWT